MMVIMKITMLMMIILLVMMVVVLRLRTKYISLKNFFLRSDYDDDDDK